MMSQHNTSRVAPGPNPSSPSKGKESLPKEVETLTQADVDFILQPKEDSRNGSKWVKRRMGRLQHFQPHNVPNYFFVSRYGTRRQVWIKSLVALERSQPDYWNAKRAIEARCCGKITHKLTNGLCSECKMKLREYREILAMSRKRTTAQPFRDLDLKELDYLERPKKMKTLLRTEYRTEADFIASVIQNERLDIFGVRQKIEDWQIPGVNAASVGLFNTYDIYIKWCVSCLQLFGIVENAADFASFLLTLEGNEVVTVDDNRMYSNIWAWPLMLLGLKTKYEVAFLAAYYSDYSFETCMDFQTSGKYDSSEVRTEVEFLREYLYVRARGDTTTYQDNHIHTIMYKLAVFAQCFPVYDAQLGFNFNFNTTFGLHNESIRNVLVGVQETMKEACDGGMKVMGFIIGVCAVLLLRKNPLLMVATLALAFSLVNKGSEIPAFIPTCVDFVQTIYEGGSELFRKAKAKIFGRDEDVFVPRVAFHRGEGPLADVLHIYDDEHPVAVDEGMQANPPPEAVGDYEVPLEAPNVVEYETHFDIKNFLTKDGVYVPGVLTLLFTLTSITIFGYTPKPTDCAQMLTKFGSLGRAVISMEKIAQYMPRIWDSMRKFLCSKLYGDDYVRANFTSVRDEIEAFHRDVISLDRRVKDPNMLSSKQLDDDILAMEERGRELLKRCVESRQAFDVHRYCEGLKHQVAKIMDHYVSRGGFKSCKRVLPYCTYFWGASGVGKSSFVNAYMAATVKAFYGDSMDDDYRRLIYVKNKEKYWVGYDEQLHCLFDDFNMVRNVPGSDDEFTQWIWANNTVPYPLEMADIESKGRTMFTSKFVTATSNMEDPIINTMNYPAAVMRRVHAKVEVKVNPQYAKEVIYNGVKNTEIDVSKLSGSGMNLDVWRFNITLKRGGVVKDCNYSEALSILLGDANLHFAKSCQHADFIDECMKNKMTKGDMPIPHIPDLSGYRSQMWILDKIRDTFWPQGEEARRTDEIIRGTSVIYDGIRDTFPDNWPGTYTTKVAQTYRGTLDKGFFQAMFGGNWDDITPWIDTTDRLPFFMWLWREYYGDDLELWYENYLGYLDSQTRDAESKIPLIIKFVGVAISALGIAYGLRRLFKKEEKGENSNPLHILGEEVEPESYGENSRQHRVKAEYQTPPRQGRVQAEGYDEAASRHRVKAEGYSDAATRNRVRAEFMVRRAEINGANKEVYEDLVSNIDVEPQACTDPGCKDLCIKILQRNMYTIEVPSRRYISRGLFVAGRVMLANYHLFGVLNELDKVVITSMAATSGGKESYTFSAKELRVVSLKTRDGNWNDAVLVQFPNRLQNKPTIMRHFIKREAYANFTSVDTVMATIRNDGETQVPVLMQAETRAMDGKKSMTMVLENGSERAFRDAYYSRRETEYGDCGAPLLIVGTEFQRKIIGIHQGGMKRKGCGNIAFAAPVSYEDLVEGMKVMETGSRLSVMDPDDEEMSVEPVYKQHMLSTEHFVGDQTTAYAILKAPYFNSKSNITESPIYDGLPEHGGEPANLDRYQDGQDMYQVGLLKYASESPVLDNECVSNCTKNFFSGLPECENNQPWSIEDAIKGKDDMHPVKRSSSPGYPYCLEQDGTGKGKTQYLGSDDEWVYDDPRLISKIQEMEEAAKDNIVRPVYFVASLKSEVRPYAKKRKPRFFAAGPMHFTIFARKYIGEWLNALRRSRIDNHTAVGINPYSAEWTYIVRKLKEKGDRIIAADFSSWDSTLQPQVVWAICEEIISWYGLDSDSHHARCIRVVFSNLINACYILPGGKTHRVCKGHPSGHPFTAELNSVVNTICYWYAMIKSLRGTPYANLSSICEDTYIITYGDDNLISVSERMRAILDLDVFIQTYKDMGMKITASDKSDALTYGTIEEVDFLKRKFRWNGIRYVAPLSPVAIFKSISYLGKCTEMSREELLKVITKTAYYEASLHDKKTFEYIMNEILGAYKNAKIAPPPYSTYEEYEQCDYVVYSGGTKKWVSPFGFHFEG